MRNSRIDPYDGEAFHAINRQGVPPVKANPAVQACIGLGAALIVVLLFALMVAGY